MYFITFLGFGIAHVLIGLAWLLDPLTGYDSIHGMNSLEPMGKLFAVNVIWLGLLAIGAAFVKEAGNQKIMLLFLFVGIFIDAYAHIVNQCYLTFYTLIPLLICTVISYKKISAK